MTREQRLAWLKETAQQRILVLDGSWGVMIQGYRLNEQDFRGTRFAGHGKDLKGNNDLLVLTRPDIIREIGRAYLDAGADIIETNSFNANAVSQGDYDLESIVWELNETAARVAREVCDSVSTPDRPRLVAGVLGPTTRTASISPDVNDPAYRNVSYDQLRDTYRQAALALMR
jgi:5-methyltetrahydrofolate--homocysteine methyltransferase